MTVFLYGCSASQSWLSSDRLDASSRDSPSLNNTVEHKNLSFLVSISLSRNKSEHVLIRTNDTRFCLTSYIS